MSPLLVKDLVGWREGTVGYATWRQALWHVACRVVSLKTLSRIGSRDRRVGGLSRAVCSSPGGNVE